MKKETSKNTRSHHCNKCLERTEKEKRKLLPRCTILKNVEIRMSSLFPSFFNIAHLTSSFCFSFLCFIPNICCSDVIVISRSLSKMKITSTNVLIINPGGSWPQGNMRFYGGVISSFDSETNKHKVVYDDGEVEKLRLHEEQWKMLEDNSSLKDSKRTCSIKDYGKELVGAGIKVWWPLDEKFYEGVVSSFDPVERKHKVIYDDGEAEKLRLHNERWEIIQLKRAMD